MKHPKIIKLTKLSQFKTQITAGEKRYDYDQQFIIYKTRVIKRLFRTFVSEVWV